MCSVPGLPTPGTEVPVLLTRVNLNPEFGFVELSVHMDDGMKHIYDQLREEIQTPQRKMNGSEGKPGDLCLVCISETWHRARIVSVHSETYNVFLIDQGQSHTATSETLAWGNRDFFLLPPEVESCVLANVLSPIRSEKATKSQVFSFLKSLSGKKFKGVVQHVLMPHRTIVLDIPLVSKVMCKYGVVKNIPGDDFKSFVLKYLNSSKKAAPDGCHIMQKRNDGVQVKKQEHYLHPELLTDTFETVTVTEVIDPNNIFCTLNIFAKALQSLSEHIHQHYETCSDFEDSPPRTCGDPCAAKGGNGRWRRSSLKSTTAIGDAVEVFHVDAGMTEVVPVGDVRPLRGEFLRMPVVTYLCSLDGVKDDGTGWTTDQTDRLKSLLLNQTVVARFNRHNVSQDVYYVTLFDADGACMTNGFMELRELLPPDMSQQSSNVQKAPSGAHEVGGVKSEIEDDDLQEELLLSTKNAALNEEMDVSMSGANGFQINESSEPSHALSCNDGHLSAGFPNNYSTNNMEVGDTEKVMVTSAETIHHFYGQLERNSHLLEEVVENVNQLIAQLPSTDHPFGLGSVCFAKYCDDQWHRGQIVEVSPRFKVHFVDYGDTCVVNESDLLPVPPEPCVARSVPVLAVPLGLFDVPVDVPQEINEWFANRATDHSLTLSVVAKETRGKLIVELFDGPLNVNAKVRERILKITQTKINGLDRQPERRLSESSEQGCVPNEDPAAQMLAKSTELNQLCDTEELRMSPQSASEAEAENEDCAEDGEPSDAVVGDKPAALTETSRQGCHSDAETTQPSPSPSERNVKSFSTPNICRGTSEEVYASSIAGPHYFWCQFANTEDLNTLSRLAQEAGKAPKDAAFPETLGPGCPCLALFPEDHQWYRVQVTQKDGDALHVLFVDYGNEADVSVEDVRPLPQSLLQVAPQAFLCSLHGFDETKGSWSDEAYDDFYGLLVDKTLRVTAVNTRDYSEFAVPQYVVQIESENVIVNDAMQKYWIAAEPGQVVTESPGMKSSLQRSHTELDTTIHDVSEGNCDIKYQKPEISSNQTEIVSASCIAEPSFFWCQYANTDVLSKVSLLAQEAGKAPKDAAFPETLGPGCPCLALFPEDHQWYRVQVTQKDGDALHVLFVDYGNEADVGVEDVRPLPQSLLQVAPQAFLCSLHGFDETKGSWSDEAYDDFYGLLVDKSLRVTVVNTRDYSEFAVPQFSVEIEREGVVVNTLMEKYWKEPDTDRASAGTSESVDQDESRTVDGVL